MANKTKTELMEEIEARNKEIKTLKKEIEKLDRYKQYENMSDELSALRESFVNSGFSKAESFDLVKMLTQTVLHKTLF